ncbi:MAG: ribosome biogenesis GTP-binding protein YihA/YsxC [Oscillospiraceae bacterium]|nr:ribosome biogenesis GTP-binding protein YihA/YsxC [Oscillospiraceae bacterium]
MKKINWHNAELHATYGKFTQFPPVSDLIPEIAFSGRSNVGKSSLINKLLNRKSLARVSSRPGKTITINYFNIDAQIFIVDLPGYGYAKISKTEKERFGTLAEKYLQSGRISLLIQLIDFRHPPTKDDLMMLDFLRQTGIKHIIVLTKADKLKKSQREKMRELYKNLEGISRDTDTSGMIVDMIEFSSETGEGVEELRHCIEMHREV